VCRARDAVVHVVLVVGDPHCRFYCSVPLITDEGYALGTLCLMDFTPRRLTFEQTEALRRLSRQVLTVLELRRRLIEHDRTIRELDQARHEAATQKARAEELLDNLLPAVIAEELKKNGRVQPVDLVQEGVDVGLRMGRQLPDSSLTVRRIASAPSVVVGTPTYFARTGEPTVPADLAAHQAVIYDQRGGGADWTFRRDKVEFTVVLKGRLLINAARTWMPIGLKFPVFRRNREFNRFGQLLMKEPERATTGPSSPAHLIRREASRCCQPVGRGGASP
jgi:DNA-binding transcriptional LysR family regulator